MAEEGVQSCNLGVEGGQLVQRCVIVQRDEKGYGLTVSGDNPVFVQSVKEDGAAARAGVQQGDRIIKVNGTLVTQSNHVEVVKLIKSGSYVALTLLGRPLAPSQWSPGMPHHNSQQHPQSPPSPTQLPPAQSPLPHTYHHHHHPPQANMSSLHKPSSPTERITGPQPVDPEKQQQLSNSKIHTIRMMLEQELAYLEKLRSDFAKNPTEKIRGELCGTQKRCRTLEEQLFNLTGIHHDCGMPQSPRSPPPLRLPAECNKENSSREDQPPPLPPPRRFQLPHQMSLPNVTVPSSMPEVRHHAQSVGSEPTSSDVTFSVNSGPTTCIPSPSAAKQVIPLSHSLDNIQRSNASPVSMVTSSTTVGLVTSPTSSAPSTTTAWVRNCRHLPHKKLHGGPTHSRQRSSPDALLHQTESLRQQKVDNLRNVSDLSRSHSEITGQPVKLLSTKDSFSDGDGPKRRRGNEGAPRASSFGSYDRTNNSPRVTPPGTPPPPYGSSEVMSSGEQPSQDNQATVQTEESRTTSSDGHLSPGVPGGRAIPPIISMEDDDFPSDNEMGPIDDHGPYNKLSRLCERPSHLAVFMHFLISNSDPSSLFFYLITELYKEGNAKEMKKWAYEIHSSFLVPGAPLKVSTVDENILHEIDNVLQHDLDKEEVLRNVFYKARKKAQEELNELLADFCNKRTLGLGGLFGPPDSQLEEAMRDKNKELEIIESLLVPSLKTTSEDIESAHNRTAAIASSLATLLYKSFGVKSQQVLNLIDRCPTFVSKEKSRLKVFNRNKKSQTVQGHHFVPQHYFHVTYCNHCQLIIWGVGNQGYQCQNCEMNIHKACVKVVEETCIGAAPTKKEKKRKSGGLMDNIMGKTRSKPSTSISSSNLRKAQEEVDSDGVAEPIGDKNFPPSRVEKLKNRYETLSENEEKTSPQTSSSHSLSSSHDSVSPSSALPLPEPSTNGDSKRGIHIGRSESLRTRRENTSRHSFRKRSDPNIPPTKSDADDATSNHHHSASSSSCSSSTSNIDSPSNSLETVLQQPSNEVSPLSVPSSGPPLGPRRDDSNDSDFEAEADPPNWTDTVDWEIVKHLKPKERKRQEVINELFHTERTHVRNLKVLEKVFYRPMVQDQVLSHDQIKLLFANLEEMLDIHGQFNNLMKTRKQEDSSSVVGNVGDLMLQMFDGPSGESFRQAAASFCKNQSIALEALKSRQKKDQKLAQFLADAELNQLCRRLQLKDIIPTGMQRLTKYPLLLENLAKYTPPNTEEYSNLMRAMECTKENLNYVNQTVKDAENHQRLVDLQKKLDKQSFDKVDHPIAQEYRNLDLTKHKMMHEGPLTWRINRQKVIDLHVLLLEHFLLLLQKQDEKYVLKFHKEETKLTHSPVIKLGNLLTRNVATDKRAFFLVSTSTVGPQIYELVAISSADRKTWFRHITEAADAYKAREGKTKKTEQPPVHQPEKSDSTEEGPEEGEKKESLESQESQDVTEVSGENSDQGEGTDTGDTSDVTSTSSSIKPVGGAAAAANDGGEESEDGAAMAAATAGVPLAGTSPAGLMASVSGVSSPCTQSPAPARRFQRVEILQIAEGPVLIEPSEVVVSQGAVLQTAEPVLTCFEKLRRKDAVIHQELKEKRKLIAEVLHIPEDEYEHVADIAIEGDGDKDAKELLLAAITESTRLSEVINESMMISEEDAVSATATTTTEVEEGATSYASGGGGGGSTGPSPKPSRKLNRAPSTPVHMLIGISDSLNRSLTQLMTLITSREEERERLRKELRVSREQIHQLHESSRRQTPVFASPSSSVHHSRPNSFISVGSSGASDQGDYTQPTAVEDVGGVPSAFTGECKTPANLVPLDGADCLCAEPFEAVNPAVMSDCSIELFVDAPPVEEEEFSSGSVGAVTVVDEIEINVDGGGDAEVVLDSSKAGGGGGDGVNSPMYGAIF